MSTGRRPHQRPLFAEWASLRAERDDLPAFLQRETSPAIGERLETIRATRAALTAMFPTQAHEPQ